LSEIDAIREMSDPLDLLRKCELRFSRVSRDSRVPRSAPRRIPRAACLTFARGDPRRIRAPCGTGLADGARMAQAPSWPGSRYSLERSRSRIWSRGRYRFSWAVRSPRRFPWRCSRGWWCPGW